MSFGVRGGSLVNTRNMKQTTHSALRARLYIVGAVLLFVFVGAFAATKWPKPAPLPNAEALLKRIIALEIKLEALEGKDRAERQPIWAAIKLLEHGVQKANNDFTPFWPHPPKECTSFPLQVQPRTFAANIREQIHYGPMKKMALLADKRRVQDVLRSFQCPHLHFIPQMAVWDVKNMSRFNPNNLPSSYILKANWAAGLMVAVKDGIMFRASSDDSPEGKTLKALEGKPVDADAIKNFYQQAFGVMYRDCEEPHYAFIDKLVVAETLIASKDGSFPIDFKLFSTMGKFLVAYTAVGRFVNQRNAFLDHNFAIKKDFQVGSYTKPANPEEIARIKPRNWSQFVETAECVTRKIYEWGGVRFARVDLYDWDNKITLGEITLTPMGGNPSFQEPEHELELGAEFAM